MLTIRLVIFSSVLAREDLTTVEMTAVPSQAHPDAAVEVKQVWSGLEEILHLPGFLLLPLISEI